MKIFSSPHSLLFSLSTAPQFLRGDRSWSPLFLCLFCLFLLGSDFRFHCFYQLGALFLAFLSCLCIHPRFTLFSWFGKFIVLRIPLFVNLFFDFFDSRNNAPTEFGRGVLLIRFLDQLDKQLADRQDQQAGYKVSDTLQNIKRKSRGDPGKHLPEVHAIHQRLRRRIQRAEGKAVQGAHGGINDALGPSRQTAGQQHGNSPQNCPYIQIRNPPRRKPGE